MATEESRNKKAMDKVQEDFNEDGNFETTSLDRKKTFDTPGFSRFRTSWGEDASIVNRAKLHAAREIADVFPEALDIQIDLWFIIREVKLDSEGNPVEDEDGLPKWVEENGMPVEDFSRLTDTDRENFILRITMYLIEWGQRAEDLWMESMIAKGKWEERFSIGFGDATGIEAVRTNEGKLNSREDRYFAIYKTAVSRKAQALVNSMELLNQRLKDTNF